MTNYRRNFVPGGCQFFTVRDWPYSSFHRMVRLGIYRLDWGGDVATNTSAFGEG
jgi:hypothetical protein